MAAHHALLFTGEPKAGVARLACTYDMHSPDVVCIETNNLVRKDVREVEARVVVRPVAGLHTVCILAFSRATAEAQNALLKMLEEPPSYALFHIIVPDTSVLLPTVRSRLMPHDAPVTARVQSQTTHEFLTMTYHERLSYIERMMREGQEGWYEPLLAAVEFQAHTHTHIPLLSEVLLVRRYLYRSGASRKMLLEHLALSVPVS